MESLSLLEQGNNLGLIPNLDELGDGMVSDMNVEGDVNVMNGGPRGGDGLSAIDTMINDGHVATVVDIAPNGQIITTIIDNAHIDIVIDNHIDNAHIDSVIDDSVQDRNGYDNTNNIDAEYHDENNDGDEVVVSSNNNDNGSEISNHNPDQPNTSDLPSTTTSPSTNYDNNIDESDYNHPQDQLTEIEPPTTNHIFSHINTIPSPSPNSPEVIITDVVVTDKVIDDIIFIRESANIENWVVLWSLLVGLGSVSSMILQHYIVYYNKKQHKSLIKDIIEGHNALEGLRQRTLGMMSGGKGPNTGQNLGQIGQDNVQDDPTIDECRSLHIKSPSNCSFHSINSNTTMDELKMDLGTSSHLNTPQSSHISTTLHNNPQSARPSSSSHHEIPSYNNSSSHLNIPQPSSTPSHIKIDLQPPPSHLPPPPLDLISTLSNLTQSQGNSTGNNSFGTLSIGNDDVGEHGQYGLDGGENMDRNTTTSIPTLPHSQTTSLANYHHQKNFESDDYDGETNSNNRSDSHTNPDTIFTHPHQSNHNDPNLQLLNDYYRQRYESERERYIMKLNRYNDNTISNFIGTSSRNLKKNGHWSTFSKFFSKKYFFNFLKNVDSRIGNGLVGRTLVNIGLTGEGGDGKEGEDGRDTSSRDQNGHNLNKSHHHDNDDDDCNNHGDTDPLHRHSPHRRTGLHDLDHIIDNDDDCDHCFSEGCSPRQQWSKMYQHGQNCFQHCTQCSYDVANGECTHFDHCPIVAPLSPPQDGYQQHHPITNNNRHVTTKPLPPLLPLPPQPLTPTQLIALIAPLNNIRILQKLIWWHLITIVLIFGIYTLTFPMAFTHWTEDMVMMSSGGVSGVSGVSGVGGIPQTDITIPLPTPSTQLQSYSTLLATFIPKITFSLSIITLGFTSSSLTSLLSLLLEVVTKPTVFLSLYTYSQLITVGISVVIPIVTHHGFALLDGDDDDRGTIPSTTTTTTNTPPSPTTTARHHHISTLSFETDELIPVDGNNNQPHHHQQQQPSPSSTTTTSTIITPTFSHKDHYNTHLEYLSTSFDFHYRLNIMIFGSFLLSAIFFFIVWRVILAHSPTAIKTAPIMTE